MDYAIELLQRELDEQKKALKIHLHKRGLLRLFFFKKYCKYATNALYRITQLQEALNKLKA